MHLFDCRLDVGSANAPTKVFIVAETFAAATIMASGKGDVLQINRLTHAPLNGKDLLLPTSTSTPSAVEKLLEAMRSGAPSSWTSEEHCRLSGMIAKLQEGMDYLVAAQKKRDEEADRAYEYADRVNAMMAASPIPTSTPPVNEEEKASPAPTEDREKHGWDQLVDFAAGGQDKKAEEVDPLKKEVVATSLGVFPSVSTGTIASGLPTPLPVVEKTVELVYEIEFGDGHNRAFTRLMAGSLNEAVVASKKLKGFGGMPLLAVREIIES